MGKIIKELSLKDYTPLAEDLLNLIDKIKDNNFESATLGGCIILKSDLKIWVIKEYRNKDDNYSNNEWEKFILQNPNVRGVKIPYKLKIALLKEKK